MIFSFLKETKNTSEDEEQWQDIQPNFWHPIEGDQIEGTLIAIQRCVGKYQQNMYILENNNEKTIVWGKSQLDDLMMQVKLDDYIRITYLGVVKTQNNRQMKMYNLQKKITKEKL